MIYKRLFTPEFSSVLVFYVKDTQNNVQVEVTDKGVILSPLCDAETTAKVAKSFFSVLANDSTCYYPLVSGTFKFKVPNSSGILEVFMSSEKMKSELKSNISLEDISQNFKEFAEYTAKFLVKTYKM